MSRYRLYILDLDGTVYRGDQLLPNAREAIERLRSDDAHVRFLTNNSGRSRAHYRDKLRGMGIAVDEQEVYTSAMAAAGWCREEGIASAFVVGEWGLTQELQGAGIKVINQDELHAERADVVVVGICRDFTYAWMNAAMQEILRGARFIATNADGSYPLEDGRLEPGAGSMVAAIRSCSGAEPLVIGKPNPYLIQMILAETGVDAEDALVIGDRIGTDLGAGQAAGCATHLVLTGVTAEPAEGHAWSDDLSGVP